MFTVCPMYQAHHQFLSLSITTYHLLYLYVSSNVRVSIAYFPKFWGIIKELPAFLSYRSYFSYIFINDKSYKQFLHTFGVHQSKLFHPANLCFFDMNLYY